jgi:type IV secretory pathway VirB2 component (pilin)
VIPESSSSGTSVFSSAVQWLQGTLLGTVATAVAVIAVAGIGLLMLSGRIDIRRATQVIFGCFILFGASTIAAGIVRVASATSGATSPNSVTPPSPDYPIGPAQQAHPATPFDPYAGAALPNRR